MDFSLDGDSKNHSFYGALTPSIFTFFCRFMATKLQPEKSTLTDLLFFKVSHCLKMFYFVSMHMGWKRSGNQARINFLKTLIVFLHFLCSMPRDNLLSAITSDAHQRSSNSRQCWHNPWSWDFPLSIRKSAKNNSLLSDCSCLCYIISQLLK